MLATRQFRNMLSTRQFERLLKPSVCQHVLEVNYYSEEREFRHPATHIFKRMKPIGLVGKGKYPLVKKAHYLYKKLKPRRVNYSNTMLCVLTKEVVGTGPEGMVVEVPKSWFRKELYPKGLALYASPENKAKYEEIRKKSRDYGIDYEKKMKILRISKMHVDLYMNANNNWILNENHIRIAMRKLGVILDNENIILDQEPKSTFGPFSFWVQLEKVFCTRLPAVVHPVGGEYIAEDGSVPEQLTPDPKQDRVQYYEDHFGAEKTDHFGAEKTDHSGAEKNGL